MQTGWQTVEINAQKGEKINITKLSLGRSCTKPKNSDRSVVCNLSVFTLGSVYSTIASGVEQTTETNNSN